MRSADLLTVWRELEAEPDDQPRMRRAVGDKTLPLFLTVDPTSRQWGILLTLPETRPVRGLPRWREVATEQHVVDDRLEVHLRLGNDAYRDVFSAVAADLLERLQGTPKARWSEVLADRIHVWHQFFREHGNRGLNQQEQRGLFAELTVLLDHVMPNLPQADAVARWVGPSGAPHDFNLPHGSIEVKAASGDRPDLVHINGLQQLDAGDGTLVLHAVRLEADDGGDTLAQLVATARGRVHDDRVASQRLERRLLEAGYLDVHEREYQTQLQVTGERTYAVGPGFPRITQAPDGVQRVRYDLDLSRCRPFLRDVSTTIESLCRNVVA